MSTRDPRISNATVDGTGRSGARAEYEARRRPFRGLDEPGSSVVNPREVGSVRYLQHLGFPVLATTSPELRDLATGREAKIGRLIETSVVGIVMWNLEPLHKHETSEGLHLEAAMTGANEIFLGMVQYNRDDLASDRLRWTELTPPEWRGDDEQALADLKTTGIFQPFEKEYYRKDGSRVPVLLGGALFEASGSDGVAFAVDLSD